MKSSLAPWLSVQDGASAIAFYKSAFGATEVYHLDDPGGGVVSRLAINGGEFWISGGSASSKDQVDRDSAEPPVRMIWTVADPDATFAGAVEAGASVVSPVSEGYGWRVGRLVDPFGHHWEIGKLIDP